jgi:hypothetical protein
VSWHGIYVAGRASTCRDSCFICVNALDLEGRSARTNSIEMPGIVVEVIHCYSVQSKTIELK